MNKPYGLTEEERNKYGCCAAECNTEALAHAAQKKLLEYIRDQIEAGRYTDMIGTIATSDWWQSLLKDLGIGEENESIV